MTAPEPLGDGEITARLAELPGWFREGDAIAKTFTHTWHECVHLLVYVAAKSREIGHHPDVDLRWQQITFRLTTHDASGKLTDADFNLARWIDRIAEGHGARPV